MSVFKCQCGTYVEWMTTKFGRLKFEYQPVLVDQLGERQGFVPQGGSSRRVVLVPLDHAARAVREKVKQAVIPHKCPLAKADS